MIFMEKFYYVDGYKTDLKGLVNEVAIKNVREVFQNKLFRYLKLFRVTAPLFVMSKTGINDDLNGTEKPVSFHLSDFENDIEIVHSLAKWKRLNIGKYGFDVYQGLYTNMNAIRKDELRDNYHSIYVDQWDYEVVIKKEDRHLDTLKVYVNKVYQALKDTEDYVYEQYGISRNLPDTIKFITSEELLKLYPNLTPDERVNEIVRKEKAVFVCGIGYPLSDGVKQDGRAPDYDDWKLNGDLFVYNDLLDNALELSSMGIRVDAQSLKEQSIFAHKEDNLKLMYQQKVLNEEVPYTLGGGIGQSRVCLFLLKKLHIGEVQSSIWDKETVDFFASKGIEIL